MSTPTLPILSEAIVQDDEDLAAAVDEVVRGDADAAAIAEEIASVREDLRQELVPEAWRTFLRIDELSSAKLSDLLVVIARWAFTEGQQHPKGGS